MLARTIHLFLLPVCLVLAVGVTSCGNADSGRAEGLSTDTQQEQQSGSVSEDANSGSFEGAVAAGIDEGLSEYQRYLTSETRCSGEEAELAAKVGFSRYHDWKSHRDRGVAAPLNSFAESGQAFEYLYKELTCRDPLVAYRYGNLLRHNKKLESAVEIMESSLPGIRDHYPDLEWVVSGSLGQAYVPLGKQDEAIAHYFNVVRLNPRDAGTRLNLAHQLYYRGDYADSRRHVEKARALNLSQYGEEVADSLLTKLDDTGGDH